jgi:outer membrane protein assembly factor BamB
MPRIDKPTVFCIALGLLPATVRSADWPQWRGPDRTDVSAETGLLKSWPEKGPKRLWSFDKAGNGYSGFSVVGGRLYTMGTRDAKEVVLALDVEKGTEVWASPIGPALENDWGDGPRGTPTADGDFIYALSGAGNVVCLKAAKGEKVWEKDLVKDLGGKVPHWGYAESVLVDGSKVICTPGGKKGALAALDKKTGEVVWRSTEFTDGAQYSSLIAADLNGTRQYVQLTMESIAGVAAEDGKLLWKTRWPGSTAVIPTPIVHNGHVYVTSGYGVGCKLVKIEAGNQATEVYANKVMKNHHGGVVRVGDHLYGHSDGAGWVCQDWKTGEMVWSQKEAVGKGAVTCADGMLYLLDERNGTVALVEPSPKGWSEKSRFQLEPQSKIRSRRGAIWTHPVVANGRLYLRDQDLIHCHEVKAY